MDQYQATKMPFPHARRGMHASTSTPALPTHLARMSETSEDNANYARGGFCIRLPPLYLQC